MTLFFYIIIGVITFVAFLHTWAKKEFDLSRTIVINKPKAEVYAFIRQLEKQRLWMPWFLEQPDTILKYKGEDGKLGASSYWRSSGKIEEGIQRITKIKEGKVIETELLFIKPYKTLSLVYLAVKELEPEKTKMVWGVRGVHRFPVSVLMLFYGFDRMWGKEFEAGLENLKRILERE